MKMEPKPKRSYGKRKAVSVPELLAVRVEMADEEIAKPKADQNKLMVVHQTHVKTESIKTDNVEFEGAGAQEISVYDSVHEIDWIEQSDAPQDVEVNSIWSTSRKIEINHSQNPYQMDATVIGKLETATIYDEHATAYNVIITEHGNFILSNYEDTATNIEGTTMHEVKWPSSDLSEQEEVIILATSKPDEHIQYET